MMINRDKTFKTALFICAAASALATLLIFGFLLVFGLPLFKGGQFFLLLGRPWAPGQGMYGFLPMIAGTASISLLSLVVAFSISLGVSFFLHSLAPATLGKILKRLVQFMTGVPTVIYGFIGVFLLVPLIREMFENGSGMCVLSASLMLGLLISPTMILFFSDGFAAVDKKYIQAARALGATRVQTLLFVVLPNAWRGLMTGLIMALGRAMGDTLIALMIAGNAVNVPSSLLDPARTLTSHIALVSAADYHSMEFKSIFACGVTLYLLNAAAVIAIRRFGAVGKDKAHV